MATTDASGVNTLTVYLSGDAWQGDPEATLTVDGTPVGGTLDVAASNALDDVEAFSVTGSFGADPVVGLSFVNDAYGGTPSEDRNLYLDGFVYDGVEHLDDKLELGYDQTDAYTLTATAAVPITGSAVTASLGVDVHLDYLDTAYGLGGGQSGPNTAVIGDDLAYLGASSIRIGPPTGTLLPEIQALAAQGLTFDVLMPSSSTDAELPEQLAAVDQIAGSVVSIEGPNETNLTSSFSWDGQTGYAAAAAYQKALYADVQADPALAGVPVLALTLGGVGSEAYQELGDLSAAADSGNVHVYYANGTPPASTLRYVMGLAAIETPGLPTTITETNYTSAPAIQGSVDSTVQAKYDLDLFLDATAGGIRQTYFYELLDEHPDPGDTDNEDHYGLFNADGSPKPAATALHDLVAILGTGTAVQTASSTGASSAPLAYTVTGLPASGNSLDIVEPNGVHDLAVWAEPEIWNVATQTEIAATARTVTVTLGQTPAKLVVYDPLLGTTPVAAYSDTSTITLQVTDHPLVVQVDPMPPVLQTVTGGAGPDTISLEVSESFLGEGAQFTASVDGKQVGGTFTAGDPHGSGVEQTFDLLGSFGTGTHTVTVDLLDGATATGGALYVDGAGFDGHASGATLVEDTPGAQSFGVVSATAYVASPYGGSFVTHGADTVAASGGLVTVLADGPSARVTGGSGRLTFIGTTGADTVIGSAGSTVLQGGADTLTYTAGRGATTVLGGTGHEVYDLVGGKGDGLLTIAHFMPGLDTVHLAGFTGGGIAAQSVGGGNVAITLTDGSRIIVDGITDSSAAHVFG